MLDKPTFGEKFEASEHSHTRTSAQFKPALPERSDYGFLRRLAKRDALYRQFVKEGVQQMQQFPY